MEFCDGGSVLDMMNASKKTLSEDLIASIAHNMLQGLEFLHSIKIIHRDLKVKNSLDIIFVCSLEVQAGNVLINKNGVAKLGIEEFLNNFLT
jgi:serine/threonine protein kinase